MAFTNSRLVWLWISVLTLSLSAFLTVAVYGSLQRIPSDVRVGDWVIGGLTLPEFEKQLEEKKEKPFGIQNSVTCRRWTPVR